MPSQHNRQPGDRLRNRAHRLAAVAGGALALLLLPLTARASAGYSGYQGTFSSSPPNGYAAAPATTDPSAAIAYDFEVTNQGVVDSQLTATVYVTRLTSYQATPGSGDVDISNPATSVDETTILGASHVAGGQPASQDLQPQGQTIPGMLLGAQAVAYSESVSVGTCGYYAVWIGDANAAALTTFNTSYMPSSQSSSFLNAGIVRVTQGCTRATPRPTPRPTSSASHTSGSPPSTSATPAGAAHAASSTPAASAAPSPSPSSRRRRDPQAFLPVTPSLPAGPGSTPAPAATAMYAHAPAGGIGGATALVAAAVIMAGLGTAAVVFLRERFRNISPLRRRRSAAP